MFDDDLAKEQANRQHARFYQWERRRVRVRAALLELRAAVFELLTGRCAHRTIFFDRVVCPEPCGYMHSVCIACDVTLEPCAHEKGH